VKKAIAKDQPLRLSDLEIPSTPYHELLAEQARLLGC
jgi:hypothetical protein